MFVRLRWLAFQVLLCRCTIIQSVHKERRIRVYIVDGITRHRTWSLFRQLFKLNLIYCSDSRGYASWTESTGRTLNTPFNRGLFYFHSLLPVILPHPSFKLLLLLSSCSSPPHPLQRTEMNWTPSRLTQQQRRRWRLVLEPRRSFIQGDVLYRGRRSRGTAAAVYPDRVMTMWTNENPRREGWRQQHHHLRLTSNQAENEEEGGWTLKEKCFGYCWGSSALANVWFICTYLRGGAGYTF